jgi:flavin reductase (DIM6/NTAB) family NADH-FMN oxidoreductase RutF
VVTVECSSGSYHGMTANSFASVSLDPMQILVSVDQRAQTHGHLLEHQRFGVNILLEDQEPVARYFALQNQDPREVERLAVRLAANERGVPLLWPCLAQLDCSICAVHESGDHSVFIGNVEAATIYEGRPLLFYKSKYTRLAAEL